MAGDIPITLGDHGARIRAMEDRQDRLENKLEEIYKWVLVTLGGVVMNLLLSGVKLISK